MIFLSLTGPEANYILMENRCKNSEELFSVEEVRKIVRPFLMHTLFPTRK